MSIFELLNEKTTAACLEAGSKKRALEKISEILSDNIPTHSQEQIFERLINRERLGSTGLGSGVALPHCRLDDIEAPVGILVTLLGGIDYDSPDNEPVDILFGLIVPAESTEEHLQLLAQLAEFFSDPNHCEQIRSAKSTPELLNIIHRWQQHAAA
jgi:PTS system nitrogen regulatory IIA component